MELPSPALSQVLTGFNCFSRFGFRWLSLLTFIKKSHFYEKSRLMGPAADFEILVLIFAFFFCVCACVLGLNSSVVVA